MTNLTEELARLNELSKNGGGGYDRASLGCKVYGLLDLANQLHALLVEARLAMEGVTAYASDEDYAFATSVYNKLHAAGIGG